MSGTTSTCLEGLAQTSAEPQLAIRSAPTRDVRNTSVLGPSVRGFYALREHETNRRPRACSSVDRASASGAEGRRFESCRARHYNLFRQRQRQSVRVVRRGKPDTDDLGPERP